MADRPAVVLLATRHRPHEQLLLAYSALIGAVYLAGTPAPASLTAALPRPVVLAWAAGLVVSGVTGVAGCWWRGERGMQLEAGGLLMNSGALLLYAVAVFSAAGVRALVPGGVIAAWAVANLWRTRQIHTDLKQMRGSAWNQRSSPG